MKIIEDTELTARILDRIRNRRKFPRKGLLDDFMLTELIMCLNKTVLKRRKEYPLSDELVLLFTMGHAIQAHLTGQFKSEKSRCVDNVWMGVDYLGDEIPWEIKMTFASSNKAIQPHWIKQIMGYCHGWNVTKFALPRVCIMGDWSWVFRRKDTPVDDRHPVLSALRLEFTKKEIEDNWAWILRRRDVARQALEDGVMPSDIIPDYAEKWECERCECYPDCPHPLIVRREKKPNGKKQRQSKGTGRKGSQRSGAGQPTPRG